MGKWEGAALKYCKIANAGIVINALKSVAFHWLFIVQFPELYAVEWKFIAQCLAPDNQTILRTPVNPFVYYCARGAAEKYFPLINKNSNKTLALECCKISARCKFNEYCFKLFMGASFDNRHEFFSLKNIFLSFVYCTTAWHMELFALEIKIFSAFSFHSPQQKAWEGKEVYASGNISASNSFSVGVKALGNLMSNATRRSPFLVGSRGSGRP